VAAALGVAVVVGVLGGAVVLRVLGGVTGDTFGAVNKLTEVTTYAALAAAW
jgi:cobalamin synthase